MGRTGTSLLHGTLDLVVLRALSWGRMHGYGIARWIERTTNDALSVEEGSLYPALYRLEGEGVIRSRWGVSETGRRAKYYELTAKGHTRLEQEREAWTRFARAMGRVIRAEPAE
jgi:transcriptional regulator